MLKVAIIGLGVMGKNHYRILKTMPTVAVVGLCDPFAENIYSEPFFTDVQALLDSQEIDAVVIAVPTFLHKDVALKCLQKKVHLFIEKPVASTIQDGLTILEEAKKQNVKVVVGHIERFNPVVQALKSELIGKEIYSINITRVGPFPPRIADVGILTDLSVHDIDLIRFITNKEIEKISILKSKKIHNHYEDNAIVSFSLQDDVIASITTNWLTPFKKRKIEVACKEGYYEADLMNQELIEYSSYQENNSFVVRNCFVKKGEPLVNELDDFIGYVSNEQETLAATIEDSIVTLKLVNS